MSKDHFYFSRNDKIVALILLFVIVVSNLIRMPRKTTLQEFVEESDSVSHVALTEESVRSDTIPVTRRKTDYSRSSAVRYERNRPYPERRDTGIQKHTFKDTVRQKRYPVKVRPSSPIDLNLADSMLLVSLPGIGPYYSSSIIRYREQLGGFESVSQLSEINGLPDSITEWFTVADSVQLRKVSVNSFTLSELRKHPYIDFYQARAIVDYRRERGKIQGPGQLSFMEEFTDRDLERLLPYLDFR